MVAGEKPMSDPLWLWQELTRALGVEAAAGPDISGLSIDSRQLQQGDLFVALPGDPGSRFTVTVRTDRDGHSFLAQAAAAGAGALLVRADWLAATTPDPTLPRCLPVLDTIDGLWQLGAFRRAQLSGPVVAITGSSGKTTAKGFLAEALGCAATAGSLNNHLGVPLSLARVPRSADSAVLEIGMNHPGEIAPLAQLVQPTVAVVVNVGLAHRENFADDDGIRREKLSIVEGLGPDGWLVVHDEVDLKGIDRDRVCRFGQRADSQVQLLSVTGLTATYRCGSERFEAQVPGGGVHRALTLASVLAVLMVLGRPLTDAQRLPDSLVRPGRGAVALCAGIAVIDDSYNANPASVLAALAQLRDAPPLVGRRYALLGAMAELGSAAAAGHEAALAGCSGLDGVWLVGEPWQERRRAAECPVLGWWPELDDNAAVALEENIIETLEKGDNLLIKGSNSVFWQRGYAARLQSLLVRAAGAAGADGSR